MPKQPPSTDPEPSVAKRYDGYFLLIPGFLAGINASVGMPSGTVVFGSFALTAAIAVLLDRLNPLGKDGPATGMAAYIGVAMGLAGMSIGYLLARFIDYVRAY